jgi:hypothetical protein
MPVTGLTMDMEFYMSKNFIYDLGIWKTSLGFYYDPSFIFLTAAKESLMRSPEIRRLISKPSSVHP